MGRFVGKTGSWTLSSTNVGIESIEMNYEGDEIDVTGMDSSGAAEFLMGVTNWSGSVTGWVNGSLAGLVPGTAISSSVFACGSTGAPKFTAPSPGGFIKSLKVNSEVKGAVNVTIQFRGSGVLVVGTV